ncbi:unnamed protein product [Meloidogyne enterolobii]|uniref:Uncharacterized protein n=1 Tax=Meloidogyne enterolobii TaxID=390850 RepID=A0ACB1B6V4_MELEN
MTTYPEYDVLSCEWTHKLDKSHNKSTLNINSPQSGAFISAGAKGSHPIYKEKGAYVNKLASTVNKLVGEDIATTPLQDRKCSLVASTNVFGRIVNGVEEENACEGKADPKNVTGNFIHIEQQRKWRDDWASNLSYFL